MSGAGSSRFADPTLGGSYGGKAGTSGGSLGVGPAGPCLQFQAPSSFSPNSILDASALMHHEQSGQQEQSALALVDNANSSKRQKVQNQMNRQNCCQAHVMPPSAHRFNSLDNTQLPCLINYHQQKSVNHQHQEQQQQHTERCYPPMHQYALQHMIDLFPKQGNCANWFKKCMADKRYQIRENSRLNWEQFVKKYYAPRAKIRWCFSSYRNAGNHNHGVLPQVACTELPCNICRLSSGIGFVVNVEVLSMLNEIKYSNEVIDELWSLNMPHERQLSTGLTVLGYNKAVQTSVYEQFRVVHSGRLRIVVTPEMKILNWEFCAQQHEVLVNGSQVRQFLQAAQNYQASENRSGSSGISRENLEANCKMLVATSRSLARSLDPLKLNNWGFSNRYFRCLQMCQVANSMKGLMDFSQDHKLGPLESYKIYQQVAAKLQHPTKQKERIVVAQGTDENKRNKDFCEAKIEIPDPPNSNPGILQLDLQPPLIPEKKSSNTNNLSYSPPHTSHESSLADEREQRADDQNVDALKTSKDDDDDDDFLEFCNSSRFDGEIYPANQK